jgi:hypothetical protein
MLSTMIMLYAICGVAWSIWEVHALVLIRKSTMDIVNTYPSNTRLPIIVVSSIMIVAFVIVTWPIEVPVTIYNMYMEEHK